jgi:hypothetical protein
VEKPLEKLIAFADRIIPKDPAIKGLLHIGLSLLIAYMSFFVGTPLAIILILCAILNSGYGQFLIFRDGNKLSE